MGIANCWRAGALLASTEGVTHSVICERTVAMWSLGCVLVGHDDRLLRRPSRLSLQCSHCGRETPGWNLGRSDEEGAMDKWVYIAGAIPGVGAVGWVLVQFFDWRRRMRASLSGTAPGES